MTKRMLVHLINAADSVLGLRKLMREGTPDFSELKGDRAIEWSWVVAHLPHHACRVLDFGCVDSVLAGIAARLGHQVTAVDLREIEYDMANVTFRKGDIREMDFAHERYDIIVNCSTIEHVGLAGRYGSSSGSADADLLAMRRLRDLLTPGGKMIVTVPVGRDAVFSPYHRVYGNKRIPLLLGGFRLEEEEYWIKERIWRVSDRATALESACSEKRYSLGLFVLSCDYESTKERTVQQ